MFKIGEFSLLTKVTVKTLRYYDKIALLKPASVDEVSGYRYYSAKQIPELNQILVLKRLGFSLAEIREVVSNNHSPESLMKALQKKEGRGC